MSKKLRKVRREELTIEQVRERLSYDQETGLFYWRVSTNLGRPQVGSVAGTVCKKGYVRISLFNIRHAAHRLAWFYVHEAWPRQGIDHIDGNRQNNSLKNLREANNSQNQQNKVARGFHFHRRDGRFTAAIRIDGKQKHLGCFSSSEEARAAYLAAHAEVAGEYSFTHRLQSDGDDA